MRESPFSMNACIYFLMCRQVVNVDLTIGKEQKCDMDVPLLMLHILLVAVNMIVRFVILPQL